MKQHCTERKAGAESRLDRPMEDPFHRSRLRKGWQGWRKSLALGHPFAASAVLTCILVGPCCRLCRGLIWAVVAFFGIKQCSSLWTGISGSAQLPAGAPKYLCGLRLWGPSGSTRQRVSWKHIELRFSLQASPDASPGWRQQCFGTFRLWKGLLDGRVLAAACLLFCSAHSNAI